MRKIILIFFLVTGCAYNVAEKQNKISNINFSDNLSLEQFKIKLDEYSANNPYPNIK